MVGFRFGEILARTRSRVGICPSLSRSEKFSYGFHDREAALVIVEAGGYIAGRGCDGVEDDLDRGNEGIDYTTGYPPQSGRPLGLCEGFCIMLGLV